MDGHKTSRNERFLSKILRISDIINLCVRLSRVSLCFPQFIIEDMKQQQTNKHSNLHREDQHITVEELWKGWKTSEGKHYSPHKHLSSCPKILLLQLERDQKIKPLISVCSVSFER